MIIWINGTYGTQLRQVAAELQRRLPDSFTSEPGALGFGILAMQPDPAADADYQHDPVWASSVASVLGRVDDADRTRTAIVAEPLTDPALFDQIIGGLRSFGHEVRHVSLLGSVDQATAAGRSPRVWLSADAATELYEASRAALGDARFGAHIDVAELDIVERANAVATALGLDVLPAQPNRVLQALAQVRTALRLD